MGRAPVVVLTKERVTNSAEELAASMEANRWISIKRSMKCEARWKGKQVVKEMAKSEGGLELFHDYVTLMGPLVRLLTTNRRRSAGVNGKFEI
jgi:hypothetical protein